MLRMNRFLKLGALALTVAFVAANIAEAQEERQGQGGQRRQGGQRGQGRGGFPGGGFGGGRGIDKLALVGIPQVKEELKISEEQMFFIEELLADHREKSREVFSGIDFSTFREKSEDERRKMMEDLQAKRAKVVKANEEVLAEFLSNAQNKRIGEISLQLRGTRVLEDEAVAKELELSGEQKKKIKEAFAASDEERNKMMEKLRASFGGGRPQGGRPEGGGDRPEGGRPQGGGGRPQGGGADFTAMREKMEALRKKTDDSVLAVLSGEQKKKFDTMKGAKFELDRSAFGRGGPGGGRRSEGGGRGGEGRGGDGGRDGGARPQRPATE